MMKVTTNFSSFVILILCFQEFVHVSSSPLVNGNQVYEESSGERNLKQEQEHGHEVHCSRERSRAAWKIIEEYLIPFVEKENYQLSRRCRLHPENDMFRDQEEHKISIDRHEWRCGYCKKSFREEKFLDQHFDNRHHNLLNLSHGKCLADLCGALHCDAVMNSKSSRSKCNPAAAARNRHLCESLADGCFPISEGPSAGRLHELFLHQFCDAHTCSGKHKPFSRGGKDQGSFFRLAAGALILVLLPVFYLFLYLVQSDMKSRTQELRRISKAGWKAKPT
ncbi:Zinc finger C2H2-type [Sesbania bispinosa]|nr:Zinc finger C2H2-type [Sesbania bispinosa]